MNRILSSVPRRTLLAGSALVLALALLTGIRSTHLAAAIGWYGAPACDDLEAQNPGDPNGCLYDAHESQLGGAGGLAACADGQDNDSDERTDCADPDCFGEANCGMGEWCNVESAEFAGQEGDCGGDDGVNKCGDGQDNDSDGLADCADPDCTYGQGTWSTICMHEDPTCAEYTCSAGSIGQDESQCGGSCAQANCADGQDNDGLGGGIDCADPSCANQSVCQNQVQTENAYDVCQDGADNDGDGSYDCDDPDCSYDQTGNCWWAYTYINPTNWWSTYETDCGNGTDDDNDGYYDCADTADCSADYRCAVNTVPTVAETSPWGYYDEYFCQNGGDDDYDGQVDCADPDCTGTAACAARPCATSEQDADGNCAADNPYWGPSCSDGYDNDQDGYPDCQDTDCSSDSACGQTVTTGAVNEIQPDGYPVAWTWGNGYCVDGIDGDQNGWTDCWDDVCDGQDPACASFTGLGTQGWPYDYRYGDGDPRLGGNNHGGGRGGPTTICGNGACEEGESDANCQLDCAGTPGYCPDGTCNNGEDCNSCSSDCGTCVPDDYCGNGVCGTGEDCNGCSADCGTCVTSENCGDGQDNDGDGMADCDDYDCGADPSCAIVRLSEAPDCSDGQDNEGDGLVDCGDPDCSATSPCNTPPTTCYTATKSAIEIAMEAGWDENGNTNVATWNRTPSGGWSSRVTELVQSQVQGLVRSAILNSLAGDGHVIFSGGICVDF